MSDEKKSFVPGAYKPKYRKDPSLQRALGVHPESESVNFDNLAHYYIYTNKAKGLHDLLNLHENGDLVLSGPLVPEGLKKNNLNSEKIAADENEDIQQTELDDEVYLDIESKKDKIEKRLMQISKRLALPNLSTFESTKLKNEKKTLEDELDILTADPSDTRKFKDFYSRVLRDVGNPKYNDFAASQKLVLDALGVPKIKPESNESDSDEFVPIKKIDDTGKPAKVVPLIHELVETNQGHAAHRDVKDEEVKTHIVGAYRGVLEGMDRVLSLVKRKRAMSPNLANQSDSDLMTGFSLFLEDKDNLSKLLTHYRTAGNARQVQEEGAPLYSRKPEAEGRYVWLGVPKINQIPGLSYEDAAEARKESKELKDKIDAFMSSTSSDEGTIRVRVTSVDNIAGARPVSSGVTALVLRVGGDQLFSPSTHINLSGDKSEEEVEEGTVKSAASSSADSFVSVHKIPKSLSIHQLMPNIENLILKWLVYTAIEDEGNLPEKMRAPLSRIFKNPVSGVDDQETKDKINNQINNVKRWVASSSKENFPEESPSLLREVVEDYFKPLADSIARALEDIGYNLRQNNNDDDKMFFKTLVASFNKFLDAVAKLDFRKNDGYYERKIYEAVSSGFREGVAGTAAQKKALLGMVLDLWKHYNKDWRELSKSVKEDNDYSLIEGMLLEWAKFLDYEAKVPQAAHKFNEDSEEIAEALVKEVINPALNIPLTDTRITSMIVGYLSQEGGNFISPFPSNESLNTETTFITKSGDFSREAYKYLVYLSDNPKLIHKNAQPMVLVPGKDYDLTKGKYSKFREIEEEGDDTVKDSKEKKDFSKFDGYTLKVVGGHRVIHPQEKRLSVNETPRFLEYAANRYISSVLANTPANSDAIPTGSLDSDSSAIRAAENMTEEERLEAMNAEGHLLFEEELATRLAGKSPAEVAKILRALEKETRGNLVRHLRSQHQLGSKTEGGAQAAKDKKRLEFIDYLRKSPESPYYDQVQANKNSIVNGIVDEITKSAKDIPPPKSTEDAVLKLSQTKEVIRRWLAGVLSVDATMPNSIHNVVYEGFLQDALTSVMQNYGYDEFLDFIKEGKTSGSPKKLRNTFQSVIQGARSNITNFNARQHASKLWKDAEYDWNKAREDAREEGAEDTEGMAEAPLFSEMFSPSASMNRVKPGVSREELVDLLNEILDNKPEWANKETIKGLLDRISGDLESRWEIKKSITKKREAAEAVINDLLAADSSAVISAIGSENAEKYLLTKAVSNVGYNVKEDADMRYVSQFAHKFSDPKEIWGYLTHKSGKGNVSIQESLKKDRIVEKKGDVITDRSKAEKAWAKVLPKGLEVLLDTIKGPIATNPELGALLAEGESITKVLSTLRTPTKPTVAAGINAALNAYNKKVESQAKGMALKKLDPSSSPKKVTRKVDLGDRKNALDIMASAFSNWVNGKGPGGGSKFPQRSQEALIKNIKDWVLHGTMPSELKNKSFDLVPDENKVVDKITYSDILEAAVKKGISAKRFNIK